MDYKKKYENALPYIKNLVEHNVISIESAEKYFPELKESEDKKPNGAIVMEDFNDGDGFYKVNLAYLNKERVEDIEKIVKRWNAPKYDEEAIRSCIGMILTDASEQRFFDFNTSLRDCLAWLEKQDEKIIPKNVDEAALQYVDTCPVDSEITHDNITEPYWNNHSMMNAYKAGWLEKQSDKDELIKELGEYKVKYTQEVLEKHLRTMNKDDERLRKTTIAFLKDFADKGYENAVECIDWLEKQGEQAKFRDSIQVGDEVTCNKDDILINLSQLNRVAKKDEKQGEHKPADKEYTFKAIPRLLGMISPTDRAKSYCQKLIDSLEQEGYSTDAKIVRDCLKQMNGEKVAMATMDEQNSAWSEEDEKKRNLLIDILNVNYPNGWFKVNPINTPNMEAMSTKELVSWLKSLRPQFIWKPSDEQIEAVQLARSFVTDDFGENHTLSDTLVELEKQLKKLK